MKKTILLLLALAFAAVPMSAAECNFSARTYNLFITSAASTNNSSAIQNAMDFIEKRGVVGLIAQNADVNPAALRVAKLWRVSDTITTTFPSWRATNNPSGPFAGEYGGRMAFPVDWQSPVAFLANEIYFNISSSDGANSFRFSGNLATNTSNNQLLSFSTTLRGQVIVNGVITADYHNGESILTHPINRLLAMPRVSYVCTDSNQLALTLLYFRNNMTMSNSAAFYMASGCGVTNPLSSRPYLNVYPDRMIVQGQRELGPDLRYSVWRTYDLNPPVFWTQVASDLSDTGSYVNNSESMIAFFKASESLSAPEASSTVDVAIKPSFRFIGENN